MADLVPSRPRRPPREGFAGPDFFRESSGAHLGSIFRSVFKKRTLSHDAELELDNERLRFSGVKALNGGVNFQKL